MTTTDLTLQAIEDAAVQILCTESDPSHERIKQVVTACFDMYRKVGTQELSYGDFMAVQSTIARRLVL